MNAKKYFIVLILICLLVSPVLADSVQRVTNGDFSSGLSGWTETTGGSGSDATVYSGWAFLRAAGSDDYPNCEITQSVDFTNVNTLTFKYYRDTWYTSIGKFRVYAGSTLLLETTTPPSSSTPANIDVSGITGTQTLKFWVSGNTGDICEIYLDDVSAYATVYPPEIYSISANGNPSGASGDSPFDVWLTASVALGTEPTSFYWQISPATGWAYISGSSSSISPQVRFTTVGDYDVYLTLTNEADSDIFSEPSFVSVNPTRYDLTVNLLDENASTFTSSTYLVLSNSTTAVNASYVTTGSLKYYDLMADTYAITASSTGYDVGYAYKTLASDDSVNITMVESGSSSTGTGASYAPHNVQIIVTSGNSPVLNASVTATVIQSSGPLSFLTDWLGFPPEVSVDSTVLSGTTDSNGAITFMMIESLKYWIQISSTDPAGSATAYIYPSDYIYRFDIGIPIQLFPTGTASQSESILTTVSAATIDSSQGYINTSYQDLINQTTSVNISVMDVNQTVLLYKVKNANANYTESFTVHDYAGNTYFVRFDITHGTFGNIERLYGKSFDEGPITFGLPEDLLIYGALIGTLVLAFMITKTGVPVGLVAINVWLWVCFAFKWLREIGDDIFVFGLLCLLGLLTAFTIWQDVAQ